MVDAKGKFLRSVTAIRSNLEGAVDLIRFGE